MTYSWIGLLLEFVFFALGVYLYLFARGFIGKGGGAAQTRAQEFRKDNATWMRFLGLALAALMGANIFLHLREIL
jgi:hypothetical protein